MKLYTRTGDDGSTGLFGGGRVLKHHPRVDAYGGVDELNACLGWTICALDGANGPFQLEARSILSALQSRLFDLGADLATPLDSKHADKVTRIQPPHIEQAERWIDDIDGANSPITAFVLPGGTELAARLHVARCVCRRAERAMTALGEHEPMNTQAIIFVNRISDLLFAMARRANKEAGVSDVPWIPS